ncbi:carbon-nitrogen hydrolase family protein [Nocardia sp. NPDC050406]|uniref:carbon-nitrogen hydrolase family protein n=1 Tax=Nocardia sp. NPDC050406 TaxID=3364318 RepID=UPI0037B28631
MIVAAAQFTARPLDIPANADTMATLIREAGARGARVVIFPELSLTGYELDAILRDPSQYVLTAGDPRLTVLRTACREAEVAALIGCPGRAAHDTATISAFVIGPEGTVLTRYDKLHVTDTERAAGFVPGFSDGRFTVDDTRFGIAVCADAHAPELAARAAADGCRVLVASSLYGKTTGAHERSTLFPTLAKEHDMHVVLANHNGRAGTYDACGGSAIWAPDGTCTAEASFDAPDLVLAEL